MRALAAACLFLAAAGAAPATAQVVDAPHWLAPATDAQPCDRQADAAARTPHC